MYSAIAPLKIQKVEKDGNFQIYFREYPGQKYKRLRGITLNKTGFASSNIIATQVWIFPYYIEKETFLKEFLHGLGISDFKRDNEALMDTLMNQDIILTLAGALKYADYDDEYFNYNHLSEYDQRILKILSKSMLEDFIDIRYAVKTRSKV
ncbi:hypothetical protein FACS1894182_13710 [Bacteroidia bacterium]|nr:hypothetical protein FACS1894182_13710 [Bacteroidia bacterium]